MRLDGMAGLLMSTAAALGAAACDGGASSDGDARDAAVDAPLAFVPPYPLPAPGTAVPIPTEGRNVANDVKPPGHDNGSWGYALFQTYGGGVLQPDYSAGGAYVFAGQGGHLAPPVFGAAMFDFTDGMWSYLPNGNGFDENRQTDVEVTETTGFPYIELHPSLLDAATPQMPAPGHTYTLMIAPPKAVVGGARGAVIRVFGTAITGRVWDTYQSHQVDLGSGVWSRAAGNLASDAFSAGQLTDQSAALDPATNRIYVASSWPNAEQLAYLDLNDRTWKATPTFSGAPGGDHYPRSIWIDAERRLLLVLASSESQGITSLWGFDLDDLAAGPTQITVEGGVPNTSRRWHKYPVADGGDGAFYTFQGRPAVAYDVPPYPPAEDQSLHRLTPPATDPLHGAWTYASVPIAGGITGEYVTDLGAGANHMSRFFYVPALRCFAWIANGSGPVELIKP